MGYYLFKRCEMNAEPRINPWEQESVQSGAAEVGSCAHAAGSCLPRFTERFAESSQEADPSEGCEDPCHRRNTAPSVHKPEVLAWSSLSSAERTAKAASVRAISR